MVQDKKENIKTAGVYAMCCTPIFDCVRTFCTTFKEMTAICEISKNKKKEISNNDIHTHCNQRKNR